MADDFTPEQLQVIIQKLDSMGIAAGRVNATMMGLNAQQKQFVQDLANGVPITRQRLREFNQALAQTTDSMKKIGDSTMGIIESVVGLTRDMSRGQADFKLFSYAINAAESAVGLLGGAFTGIAGKLANSAKITGAVSNIAGGAEDLTKILGALANHMVNVFDDGIKSFINLSKVGGVGADGLMDLADQFRAAGLPMQRFEAIVKSNSDRFAKMGGTVSRTAGIIADELGDMKRTGFDQGLRNLGFASEEIADTMISYADLQRRLGNEQFLDEQRLRQGTIAYGKELDEIARITGMSREQAQKEADAAMANARFNARLRMLEAENTEQSRKAASELRKMNAVYTKYGMEKGFQDMATGFINTAEAQQLFLASNGQAYEATQAVTNGQMGYLDALKQSQVGVQRNTGMLTAFSLAAGNGAGQFGDFAKSMDFASADITSMTDAAKDADKAFKTPNTQTQELMASFAQLELASSELQQSFLTMQSIPGLMLDTAELYRKSSQLLADAIRGDSSIDLAQKERYKTSTQKDIDADIKSTQELIDSGNLTAAEQVKTRERLDELVKLQDKAIEAQKATKTAIEQGGGPLGVKITDSLKADQLNREVKQGYEALKPTAPIDQTKPAAPVTAGPKLGSVAVSTAPTAAINDMLNKQSVTPEGASPAVNIDPVVRELQGMRADIQQGNENIRTEMSKGNRINANR